MTVLISADFHLTDQSKERYRFKALEWMLDLIAKRSVERFIILGDLTHTKNHHSDVLVNDVVGYLHEFAKLCPVYVLQGNHDYIEAETAFFQFTRLLQSIQWIWQPRLMQIADLGNCCFLPHTRDYKKDWNKISEVWGGANLIFAHNAFEGAIAESGKRLSGIPLSIFPKDVTIISGDIHQPQRIGDNLLYVGSPYTQKFGDNFEPRVLMIQNNSVIESIPVPGPQKRLLDLSGDTFEKVFFQKEDMVKVRYHLCMEDRDKWPDIKKMLQKHYGTAQVVPVLEQKEVTQVSVRSSLRDDKQLIRDYGQQQNLSPDMLVTGYELFNET